MGFVKAQRQQRKLRLALMGPTGSGKTYTALQLARGIVGPTGRIALIDTENFSASLYADKVEFDVLGLSTFAPGEYVKAIQLAEEAGYDIVVVDSLSHAWSGKDGALERVDRKAAASSSGSSFHAWRDVTPQHNAMVDALVRCRSHLIVTMRVKMEHVQEKDERGRTVIRKVGLQAVQRDGLEYEFDVVADLNTDHVLTVSKTRCSDLDGAIVEKPDALMGRKLIAWLNSGAPAAPAQPRQDDAQPTPAPTPAAPGKSIRAQVAEAIAEWSGIAANTEDGALARRSVVTAAGVIEPKTDADFARILAWVGENRARPFAEAVAPKRPEPQPASETQTPAPETPAATEPGYEPGASDAEGDAPASKQDSDAEFNAGLDSLTKPPEGTVQKQVVIEGVSPSKRFERNGREGFLYPIKTDRGELVTFSKTAYMTATRLKGQRAVLICRHSDKGLTVESVQAVA